MSSFTLERQDGTPISPFHDIPLYSNDDVRVCMCVYVCVRSPTLALLPPSRLTPSTFNFTEVRVQYGSGGTQVDQC